MFVAASGFQADNQSQKKYCDPFWAQASTLRCHGTAL
jgi:hypothetical protein